MQIVWQKRRGGLVEPYIASVPREDLALKIGPPGTFKTLVCEVRWVYEQNVTPMTPIEIVDAMMAQTAALCRKHVSSFAKFVHVMLEVRTKPYAGWRKTEMQRLFTIEVRVDFRDEDKVALMQKAIQQAARHVYAQAGLLGDAVKPQIVIYSHDYFQGHADIALFDDDVESGKQAITEAGNSALTAGEATHTNGSAAAPVVEDKSEISQEMLDALK